MDANVGAAGAGKKPRIRRKGWVEKTEENLEERPGVCGRRRVAERRQRLPADSPTLLQHLWQLGGLLRIDPGRFGAD